MTINRYRPHVFVLPEDDANRQLANGFLQDPSLSTGKIQVLDEVGGWPNVLHRFQSDHIAEMDSYSDRFMVLLIDFDKKQDRLEKARAVIPDRMKHRVFILGASNEPEDLKKAKLGSYEAIGLALAKDCREETDVVWNHDLLRHNAAELGRLRESVRPILF